jgi:predicted Zn-dependent protease
VYRAVQPLLSFNLRLSSSALRLAPASLALAIAVLIPPSQLLAAATPSLVCILKAELDREFGLLKTKADPAPYYMAYEVTEEQADSASASLGALVDQVHMRSRGLDTTIRVGSPKFDNYHPYKGTPIRFTVFRRLSLGDDANEIKRAAWEESDRVYRLASRRFLQLKTDEQLIAAQSEQDSDFSVEPAATYSQLPEAYSYDMNAWAQKLRAWSAEFKGHSQILVSGIGFRAQRETRTLVNTEGTAIQQGNDLFRIEINAAALAPDGMDVQDFASFEAADPTHLPAEDVVQSRVREVASKVDALVNAPPAEPIVCPAILSGRASAVFFHEIFGHRVEGHRQKDITEDQTFTKMLGQKVLPSFISVEFDPTKRTYNGSDLIGDYEYDDEGVKARPVRVVEDGVLKTFLLSRSPVGEFVHSNGHGRRQAGFEVVARQSNLIVESSRQLSDADLRAQLIDEIKRQNKPYGLYFEDVASGYTTTGRQGTQAFKVVPLVVYRVYANGRPDELIRGVDIVGTPLASFQKILATSDRVEVFNGYCGAESGSIPVSAVSPAILVSEIETQKKQNAQRKTPLLARPEAE